MLKLKMSSLKEKKSTMRNKELKMLRKRLSQPKREEPLEILIEVLILMKSLPEMLLTTCNLLLFSKSTLMLMRTSKARELISPSMRTPTPSSMSFLTIKTKN